jgi:Tfp pilus assembly protein PilN
MPLQRLDLNLVPAPTAWERHHLRLGWGALAFGAAALVGALLVSGWTYWQARQEGRQAVMLTAEARRAAQEQERLKVQLADVDVGRELPRWRTAERVLQERALPWSRLLAELEMDLPDGVRLRSIQRVRGREGVTLKLKGEAKMLEAEEAFIDALRANPTYAALALERESERQGSGLEFELTLTAAGVPKPFAVRPHPAVKAKGAAPAPMPLAPAPRAALAPSPTSRTKPAAPSAPVQAQAPADVPVSARRPLRAQRPGAAVRGLHPGAEEDR